MRIRRLKVIQNFQLERYYQDGMKKLEWWSLLSLMDGNEVL